MSGDNNGNDDDDDDDEKLRERLMELEAKQARLEQVLHRLTNGE